MAQSCDNNSDGCHRSVTPMCHRSVRRVIAIERNDDNDQEPRHVLMVGCGARHCDGRNKEISQICDTYQCSGISNDAEEGNQDRTSVVSEICVTYKYM